MVSAHVILVASLSGRYNFSLNFIGKEIEKVLSIKEIQIKVLNIELP